MERLIHAVLAVMILTGLSCCISTTKNDFTATDFTSEHLFTSDIEGPNFRDGILYVVNFERNGTIGMINERGQASLFVALPDSSLANAIQFNSRGEMLLADWKGHNVLKVDMNTKAVSVFAHNDAFNQPNDLCVNSRDQVFASDPNWKNGTGQLWRIDPDGSVTLLIDSMGTTNGIELSPDEKTLYVNESVQRKIWKFEVNEMGGLSGKTLFAEFEDHGFDGMKCDADGNLYVTRYGKGTVVVLSSQGNVIREIQLKGLKPSNIAFGGEDGKTCFVTLQDRGCVEIFRTDVPGKAFRKIR